MKNSYFSFLKSFNKETLLFFILAFGFIFSLAFNLNLSSSPEWKYYADARLDSGLISGKSRSIRSDEWFVQTPYYASQVLNNFNVKNISIGPGNSTLLAGVPVADIYGYVQPRYWGFYLAGFDRGLSWIYAFRLFGLLISGYLIFKLITKNDFWLSLTGAFWITFSSFTQWWFGTNLPDMMIGAFLSIFSIYSICYIENKSKYAQIMYGLLLFFSAMTFITALYPPFQIPLGYFSLFLLIGLFLRDTNKNKLTYFKLANILVPFILILIVLINWALQSFDIIQLVLNSVYPGRRESGGGGLGLYQLIAGYLGPFIFQNKFPDILGNVCEASSFYYLFIYLFLIFAWSNRTSVIKNPVNICLFIYLSLLLIWVFFGYGTKIAGLSKMSMSPPFRSLIGLGLANIFLCVSLFSSIPNDKKNLKKNLYIYTLLILSISSLIPYSLYNQFSDFMTIKIAFLTFLLLAIFGFSFLYRIKYLFILSILFVTINGMYINPIVQGVPVLHDQTLINLFNSKTPRKWIAFSDLVRPQYLKAHGEKVLNGTKYISDSSDMKILDPERKYENIWYRYSHLLVINDSNLKSPEFKLIQLDIVQLKFNICGEEARLLGITNAAFISEQDLSQIKCIQPINNLPIDGMWLYAIKN